MRGGSSRHEYAVLDRGSACLQCKRRKKRCDGAKPVCGPCVRFGTADQCEFPRPPTPKLKPKPSPPRSKSEALRMQIRDLEEQLATLQKAVSTKGTGDAGPSSGATHLAPPPSASLDHFDYDVEQRATGDSMDEDEYSPLPKAESPLPHVAPTPDRDIAGSTAKAEELLHIFLRHRRRCGFEVDDHRFTAQFLAPPKSPDAMHPGLVNAVQLLGCHFASQHASSAEMMMTFTVSSPADLEAYYLEQTREKLAKSLTAADRLGDFLRGSALLVWYYFAKGRIAEAQYHASGVSCFASACRLHLLSNPSLSTLGHPSSSTSSTASAINNQPTQIIPPAQSHVELEERISLFWSIFVLDRYAALICGTTTSIQDESVWTSWPRDAAEWDTVRAELPHTILAPTPETLFPVLDYSTSSTGGTISIPQSDLSYRATSLLLLDRSTRLAKATSAQTPAIQREYDTPHLQRSYDATKAAARRIAQWLPPYASSSPSSILSQAAALAANPDAGARPSGPQTLSPRDFQVHPSLTPASGASSTSSPTPLSFHHHHQQRPQRNASSSSLPPSPHPGQNPSGTASGFGLGFEPSGFVDQPHPPAASYSHAHGATATLILAHSALDATWIHLNTAARALPLLLASEQHEHAVSVAPALSHTPARAASSTASGEFYRPQPEQQHQQQQGSISRPASSSSHSHSQLPLPLPVPNRPTSASAIYQPQPQPHPQPRPHPQREPSQQQQYHQQQQQHHAQAFQYVASQQAQAQAQMHGHGQHGHGHMALPIAIPVAPLSSAANPSQISVSPTTHTHWSGVWSPDTDPAGLVPWIGPSSTSSGAGGHPHHTHGQHQQQHHHQAQAYLAPYEQLTQPQLQMQYAYDHNQPQPQAHYGHAHSQTIPNVSIPTVLGVGVSADEEVGVGAGGGKGSLVAAREIADLAQTALGVPAIFDELDMMIGLTWTAAFQVLSDEIHRREGVHTRDRSEHSSPVTHEQQQAHAFHYPPHSQFVPSSQQEGAAHPSYRGGDSDSSVEMLTSLRDQREILRHALERLSAMFQLVGVMRTSSF